ncbi:MAG: NADPH:quinone reductase [Planctomycetota bacterium]
MKAAFVPVAGPAETIEVGDLPTPKPQAGQVLVRVRASAVNPIDVYVRSGAVAMPLPSPFIPGCDLAGEVVEVGEGVTRFTVGDRVWGSNQGLLGRQGTLAELAAVDEAWLYATPDGVDDETAAAGALVGITAGLGLFHHASLQAGETVLVNGGAGGVGSTVIQMAKAQGARVIATASSEAKRDRCRELGADEAIDYREAAAFEPYSSAVDLWWEASRTPDLRRIVATLAERGRAVLMAGRDAAPELPVGPFYVKGLSLVGFAMFKDPPEVQRAAAERINTWLASGAYRPPIDRVFNLDQAADAHRLQEENTLSGAGTLSGKIVVAID